MPRTSISLMPAATMVSNQHKFGVVTTEGKLNLAGAGARAVGVIQTPGIVGEPCNVMVSGISFIVIGATLAAGQEVEADATGKAIPLATGKSNGICLVGGAKDAIGCILVK